MPTNEYNNNCYDIRFQTKLIRSQNNKQQLCGIITKNSSPHITTKGKIKNWTPFENREIKEKVKVRGQKSK